MSLAIKVHNLTKQYGKILAVDNISFTVNQGEVFGFLGPNGAGKTSRYVCLLDRQNQLLVWLQSPAAT